MAVTVADLLAPPAGTGPIEATLFPGEGDGEDGSKVHGRMGVYLSQAETKAAEITWPDSETEDNAVKAWALYLAYMAAYRLALARASTRNYQTAVLGSDTYAKDQRDGLLALANEQLAIYEDIVLLVPTNLPHIGPPSRVTPLLFDY